MFCDVRNNRYGRVALLILLGVAKGVGYSVLALLWSVVSSLLTFGLVLSYGLIPQLTGADPRQFYQLGFTLGMLLLCVHFATGVWPFHRLFEFSETLGSWAKTTLAHMRTKGDA